MQQLLEDIITEVRPLIGKGEVASYIPELGNVARDKLGMAVCTVDGTVYQAGDAAEPFSIQSISKALALTLAMNRYGDELWERVGKEPSGQAFNSLAQLEYEKGIPRNPFINAGALVVTDALVSRLSAPKHRILDVVRQLSGNPQVVSDQRVALSEYRHSDRNAAISYLMKSFGNIHNDVDTLLQTYFYHCALRMSCVDLARTFIYLANGGYPLNTDVPLLSAQQTKQLNALLMVAGLYDVAGDFAYRVGMPGKSGVGGGIVAVIPGELCVCVWSPELNQNGNSLVGTAALELFTTALGRSVF
ncbi:glutaminase B [Aliamphritea spongicola]|uniref:glutaminase B n=1 Tax=Aliamphritea spongicola TaxID=707589 RepID=UPI00196B7D2E|nr:glutaminase B [Aliamphritea spongicola]MBN3561932.1 glutaminase B [Aliamphritea spongicola]